MLPILVLRFDWFSINVTDWFNINDWFSINVTDWCNVNVTDFCRSMKSDENAVPLVCVCGPTPYTSLATQ